MDKKTLALSGLLALAPVSLTNAQKAVANKSGEIIRTAKEIVVKSRPSVVKELVTETGVTGVFNGSNSFYGGLNFCASTKRNYFDGFLGASVNENKQANFMALALNNYKWAKHTPLSSWFRSVFSASNRGASVMAEVSPVRVSFPIKKFDFAFNPSVSVNSNFKSPATFGLNQIGQVTYHATPRDHIFFEAKYMATPAKNLKDVKFGPVSKNTSYMMSYMHTFKMP